MTRPTPRNLVDGANLLAPLGDGFVEFIATLSTSRDMHDRPHPSSWFITHALGSPAAGTYTEVRIEPDAGENAAPLPEHIVDAVVRRVAVTLYGLDEFGRHGTWAFHYRPEQYAASIERHGMRLREVVVVEGIEVQ